MIVSVEQSKTGIQQSVINVNSVIVYSNRISSDSDELEFEES